MDPNSHSIFAVIPQSLRQRGSELISLLQELNTRYMHVFDDYIRPYESLQDREEQVILNNARLIQKLDLEVLLSVRDTSVTDMTLIQLASSCTDDLGSMAHMHFVFTLLSRALRCNLMALRTPYPMRLNLGDSSRQDQTTKRLMKLALDSLKKNSDKYYFNKHRDQSLLLLLFHQWFQPELSGPSPVGNALYDDFVDFLLQCDFGPLAIETEVASNLLEAVYSKYGNSARAGGRPLDEFCRLSC